MKSKKKISLSLNKTEIYLLMNFFNGMFHANREEPKSTFFKLAKTMLNNLEPYVDEKEKRRLLENLIIAKKAFKDLPEHQESMSNKIDELLNRMAVIRKSKQRKIAWTELIKVLQKTAETIEETKKSKLN